jgi:acetyl-CoA carboxylase carboxyltransferase component
MQVATNACGLCSPALCGTCDRCMRGLKRLAGQPFQATQHSAVCSIQVWYPDSATKTAQAIEECNKEGLPLIVLANWRGFSGGQRDLFEGILQAGSCIVESLRSYKWPVMVYLPPGCELRGGAWVVLDSQINSDMIEMYAGAPRQVWPSAPH